MTPAQKITEYKTLLAEAKEALMNRDPHTRGKECYDSGAIPCKCTLCKINEALHDQTPLEDCCKELAELKEQMEDLDLEAKFNDTLSI